MSLYPHPGRWKSAESLGKKSASAPVLTGLPSPDQKRSWKVSHLLSQDVIPDPTELQQQRFGCWTDRIKNCPVVPLRKTAGALPFMHDSISLPSTRRTNCSDLETVAIEVNPFAASEDVHTRQLVSSPTHQFLRMARSFPSSGTEQWFMQLTRARLKSHGEVQKYCPGERPLKVAVVGAGPVGLWIAVLLSRTYSRLFVTQTEIRMNRLPLSPFVDVYERRTDESGYGSRRILLAISPASQDLLNRHMLSGRQLTSDHCFSPTCSINCIESALREEFEKYVAAGFGKLHLGDAVQAPETLLEDHDVVVIATGRGYPGAAWRAARRMEMRIGQSDLALIVKFSIAPNADGWNLAAVQAALSRFETKAHHKTFLRAGASEDQGYLWVVGLEPEFSASLQAALQSRQEEVAPTGFRELWLQLVREAANTGSKSSSWQKAKRAASSGLVPALKMLDKQLQPVQVVARMSEACYWHSEEVVQRITRADGSTGWIVLVGDTACGKPFYTGSTLNGHFHDTMTLIPYFERGQCICPEQALEPPFKRYINQYRRRIDAVGFRTPEPSRGRGNSAQKQVDSLSPKSAGKCGQ